MVERDAGGEQEEKQYPEAIRGDEKMKGLYDSGVALAAMALNGLHGFEQPGINTDLAVTGVTAAAHVLASNYPEFGDEHLLDERSPFLRSTDFWRQQMSQEAERRGLLLEQPVQIPVFRRRGIWPRRRGR